MTNATRLFLAPLLVLGLAGSSSAQWTFTDVTAAAHITHTHGYTAPTSDEYILCGGVAAGDYDGDGWIDLFAVHGDVGPNLLYRNNGDGTFTDMAASAGVDDTMLGCGAVFADYDGDGALDLLVTAFDNAPSKLYHNNGDGTFADVSANLPLTRKNNISASFGDYDRDGDLDVFVAHWLLPKVTTRPVNEHLWRNNGDGTFTDVGLAAGIIMSRGLTDTDKSFTPNFTDLNGDGWPDIALSADFGESQVFLNDGDGTFTDATDPAVITDQNGMGSALCDYDFDGDLDWLVTSIYYLPNGQTGNRFYRNQGDGVFEDVTTAAGTRDGGWGWGASCQDFDNDGDVDIFHVNGFDNATSQTDPARLFVSDGVGAFTEEAAAHNIADTGRGLGVVAFDYDRDGDLDIFFTNNQAAPKLFRNDGLTQNHLTVKLTGLAPNTQAIGSRVIATIGGTSMVREIHAGSNYISQDPAEAHFGLGSATSVDQLEVQWFLGGSTVLTGVAANQILTIAEPPNTCGDGTLDAGEQCDEGAANGGVSCCQVNCRLRPSGATCRGASDACDTAEVCDGVAAACPADAFQTAGTECRAAADVCDVAESCTGTSAACPADSFEPDTTECRSAAGACDVADFCTGTAAACPADAKSTSECRPAAGLCDVAETCDGVNDACPGDDFELSGVECRAAAGPCDLAESCTGTSAACPGDQKSTGLCRAAAGLCDVEELCDGVNDACPADTLIAAGNECRTAGGLCDVAEACDGVSPNCPADGFLAAGTECRPQAADCDVAETCTGSSAQCPANGFALAGTVCRAAVDGCDAAETCPGNTSSCPTDEVVAAGTECRTVAGACDLAESCDGLSKACPADAFKDTATECRPSGGSCDPAESCTGSSAACPGDAKSTDECRPSAGVCDPAESCDGVADDCPSDQLDAGTECRAAIDACDVAESCDGVGPTCPADLLSPAGTVCRTSTDACDIPETCSGIDTACPADTGLPDGDSDGACDALDVCPTLADPDQLDDDSDGLGNVCDPCTALQASVVTKPKLKLVKLTRDPGEQKLKLKGEVTLPTPITPALDPTTGGVRLVIGPVDTPREPVLDITIPGGPYDRTLREGWLASPSGLVFKFKSKTGVDGITKVLLKVKSAADGLVQFVVVGKNGNFPFLATDVPLAVTLTINDVAGQCAEYAFDATGSPDPACDVKSGGDKILCR